MEEQMLSWTDYVKAYSKHHQIPYHQALAVASPSYKVYKEQMQQAGHQPVKRVKKEAITYQETPEKERTHPSSCRKIVYEKQRAPPKQKQRRVVYYDEESDEESDEDIVYLPKPKTSKRRGKEPEYDDSDY